MTYSINVTSRREMAEIVRKFLKSSINFKKAQYRNMAKYIGVRATTFSHLC